MNYIRMESGKSPAAPLSPTGPVTAQGCAERKQEVPPSGLSHQETFSSKPGDGAFMAISRDGVEDREQILDTALDVATRPRDGTSVVTSRDGAEDPEQIGLRLYRLLDASPEAIGRG